MSEATRVSENFWWSEDGRLSSLKQDSAAILVFMWISVVASAISTLFISPKASLLIIYISLFGCSFVWWSQVKDAEKWLDMHYGDWG